MPSLAILSALNPPPGQLSDAVQFLGYRHAEDGEDYIHEFGDGVGLATMPDGSLTITHAAGEELHRDHGGKTFLVNPPKRGNTMATTKRRHYKSGPKKGQFMPGKARKASSSTKKRRRRNPAPAMTTSPRKRNPPRKRLTARSAIRGATEGAVDAFLVLTGKAATRSIPLLANLPKEGNIGLAVQALTAIVVGMVAQQFLKPAQAKMLTAGGLTAPLETLIVSYNVPFLAPALQPVEADAQLSAYLGGYVQPVYDPVGVEEGVGGYVQDGMGMYGEPAYA